MKLNIHKLTIDTIVARLEKKYPNIYVDHVTIYPFVSVEGIILYKMFFLYHHSLESYLSVNNDWYREDIRDEETYHSQRSDGSIIDIEGYDMRVAIKSLVEYKEKFYDYPLGGNPSPLCIGNKIGKYIVWTRQSNILSNLLFDIDMVYNNVMERLNSSEYWGNENPANLNKLFYDFMMDETFNQRPQEDDSEESLPHPLDPNFANALFAKTGGVAGIPFCC